MGVDFVAVPSAQTGTSSMYSCTVFAGGAFGLDTATSLILRFPFRQIIEKVLPLPRRRGIVCLDVYSNPIVRVSCDLIVTTVGASTLMPELTPPKAFKRRFGRTAGRYATFLNSGKNGSMKRGQQRGGTRPRISGLHRIGNGAFL
jgi:hypothetical protein